MKFLGGYRIGGLGLLLAFKTSKMDFFTMDADFSRPLLAGTVQVHPFNARFTVLANSRISDVLRMIA